MSKSKYPKIGVYCYYRGETPLYVGRSIDLHRRQLQHKNNKRFEGCNYVILEETSPEHLKEREYFYIEKLQPLENRIVRTNTDIPEVRKKLSDNMKKNNPMKPGMTNSGSFKKGHKPVTHPDTNKKKSESKKGENNPNYGKKGLSKRLNTLKTCPSCGKILNKGNYVRWGHPNSCT